MAADPRRGGGQGGDRVGAAEPYSGATEAGLGSAGLGNSTTTIPTGAVSEGHGGGVGVTYDALPKDHLTRVPLSRNAGPKQGQGHGHHSHEENGDKGAVECWPDPTGGTYCFAAPRY